MTARKPLTHAEVARHAAIIAAKAARWSGDFLTFADDACEPVDADSGTKFTAEIRRHLDSLDARLVAQASAGPAAPEVSAAGGGDGI